MTFCPYFNQGQCRSCQWIEEDYPSQLRRKELKLLEALNFFPNVILEPSVSSPNQGFRNRIKMSVTGTIDNPIIGLLGTDTLDQGREILSCPIHHPKLNDILKSIPNLIQQYRLAPYNISNRKGELKGLIVFYSSHTHQAYLRFVLR